MSVQKIVVAVLVLLIGTNENLFSQVITKTTELQSAAIKQAANEKIVADQLQKLSKEKGWPLVITGKKGRYAVLTGVDTKGYPMYTSTDNLSSALTTRTNALWAGGSTGLNLSGSSNNMKGKMGIWDGGSVRNTHVELTGRILQKDAPPGQEDHATHVAGTMIATGINPQAKGMAFGLQQLVAYDFSNHLSEMMNEAPNLLISNHSYGAIAGWRFNDADNRWEFWGNSGATEDFKFGYYSTEAQVWDSIAYNAPFYLIVKSAGNNRDENGPAVGAAYFRFNASNVMAAAGNRPAGISSNDSYDCISTYGTSKNILTVGAIGPITSGYIRPQDAIMTSYSSWGPTDDGRIKPDVVANGEDVLSTIATSDNAYAFFSGTSMCTPNASGSLFLLQEEYSKLHAGAFLRAASIKGIVIHTADEAGSTTGPDYQFGWGVINMVKAVGVITSTTDSKIEERTLDNAANATYSTTVVASGKGPLVVTISWTDPKGTVDGVNQLNNPAKKLVNDLDVRVKIGATTYLPWTLNPAPNMQGNAAVPGDNVLDNVEKIEIPDAVPGQTYTIEVTHKGTLERGSQAYSLIVSGIGGIGICASNATSNAGGRIDSVSFGTIHKLNPAGCTTYTNYTSITGDIEASSTIPLYVRVNACDASTANKMVKAYIDFNNDGDFNDAGEEVAASATAIAGNGVFTANVTIPAGLAVGNYTIMRIVMVETSTAASILPCGTYANGETQDYRIRIVNSSKDLGVVEVVSPFDGSCAAGNQYVTIHIKNYGSASVSNFPVSAVVKIGATTVATLNETYPGTVDGFGEVIYTFQTPFGSIASTAYTITSTVTLAGDQNTANNQNVSTITTSAPDAAPTGQAEICGTQAFLKTAASTLDQFNWYTAPTGGIPIASGATATTSIIPANKTYYLAKNDIDITVGPANKLTWPGGGYNVFANNYVRFNNDVPFILENARLYIGNGGQINFVVGKVTATSGGNPTQYQIVSSTTIDVFATKPTPPLTPLGTQDNDPADLGAVYYLGLVVPTTGDHIIIINCLNGASIFRNNGITTNPYPFTVPGVMSITGNSGNPSSAFYYFFYDMHLSLANCGSARAAIVATTAVAPVITQTTNTLNSNKATGNQWYQNNNPVAGATSQAYTPIASGTYKTVVTDDLGCSLTSNEINVTVTGIPNIDPQEIGLKILPNPNNGIFGLEFNVRTKSDLVISMFNAVGQEVYKSTTPGFTGRFAKQMQLGKLAHGVYLLRIQHDKKNYLQKIIIR